MVRLLEFGVKRPSSLDMFWKLQRGIVLQNGIPDMFNHLETPSDQQRHTGSGNLQAICSTKLTSIEARQLSRNKPLRETHHRQKAVSQGLANSGRRQLSCHVLGGEPLQHSILLYAPQHATCFCTRAHLARAHHSHLAHRITHCARPPQVSLFHTRR